MDFTDFTKADRSDQAQLPSNATDRRDFLRYLAASPALASLGGMEKFLSAGGLFEQHNWTPTSEETGILKSPNDAFDVFDFEMTAHSKVPQGHWAYMASGTDADKTLHANREAFDHIYLRPRRMRDMTKLSTKFSIWGENFDAPIFTCPTGGQRSFSARGELDVSAGAKARNAPQMLSTNTSDGNGIEQVNEALGRPCWYSLYAPANWERCEALLDRVWASGTRVLVLTCDVATGRNSETDNKLIPKDLKQCMECHTGKNRPGVSEQPMLFPLQKIPAVTPNAPLDWAYADKIRAHWKGKFVLKGVLTAEDAGLCVKHGFDAVHVSNHGGRSTETGESTIESLPPIIAEVRGRIPVFIDSGFRRGTDIFKALALGATAVGVGRPILWGIGSFGAAGSEKVLEILQRELKLVMGNCGTETLADINRQYVNAPDWKLPPDFHAAAGSAKKG